MRSPSAFDTGLIADRVAIQDLVFNYAHALDSRNFALFENLWATDAAWLFPQVEGMAFYGRDAILQAFARPTNRTNSPHHLTSNLLVTIDGDRATGRCKALSSGFENPHFVSYEDEYVRCDGGWKFRKRTVSAHLADPSKLPNPNLAVQSPDSHMPRE